MPAIYRNGIRYGNTSSVAQNVNYDNTDSGLAADNIQEAIDENTNSINENTSAINELNSNINNIPKVKFIDIRGKTDTIGNIALGSVVDYPNPISAICLEPYNAYNETTATIFRGFNGEIYYARLHDYADYNAVRVETDVVVRFYYLE